MTHSADFAGMQRRPRHMTLFMSIAITFLIICLLWTLSSGFSLEFSTRTYQQEQNQVGLENASHAAKAIHGRLTEYIGLMDLISADENLQDIPKYYTAENNSWISNALRVRSTLLSAQANFGDVSIQNMLVYYPQSALLISSKTLYTRDVLSYFLKTNGLEADFLARLPSRRYGIIVSDDGTLWLIRGIYQNQEIASYILIQASLSQLQNAYLTDSDQLLLFRGEQCVYPSDFASPPVINGASVLSIEGQSYYAATEMLASMDLQVFILQNAASRLSKVQRFHTAGLITLLGSVCIILVLALVFTYRIYHPIRNLLTNAMIVEPAHSVTHALDSVSHTLQKLSEEKKQYADSMQAAYPLIQGEKLADIVRAPASEADELYLAFLSGNDLLGSDHTVSVTCIRHVSSLSSSSALSATLPGHYSMACMLLDNYLNTHLHFSLLKYGDDYVLLTDGTREEDLLLIQQAVAEYVTYFRDRTTEEVLCTPTRLAATSDDLRGILLDLSQEMENLRFYGGAIPSSTNRSAPRRPFPTLTQLHTLNRLLESENYAEARSSAEQMLDALFAQNPDYTFCIHRVQGLIMLILAGMHKRIDGFSSVDYSDLEARICQAPNIEALREEMESILDTVFSEDLITPQDSASQMHGILEYLEKNYADHDLSLSALSQQFAMDESTISRIFRQEMNMTFLECIQRIRLRKAKELLPSESVKDTARHVGFWDAQALIRVFKKYEGITPGQFKDACKGSQRTENET